MNNKMIIIGHYGLEKYYYDKTEEEACKLYYADAYKDFINPPTFDQFVKSYKEHGWVVVK